MGGVTHGPVPAAYVGVWQRTLLDVAGAEREAGSLVFWLQTPHWHGDLRLPDRRPDFAGCNRLADCTPEQRRWLVRQKGFAGITQISAAPAHDGNPASYCQWHRQVDYQPTRQTRDYGRIVFYPDGQTLDEFGVDAEYRETWVRLPHSAGPTAAWRRPTPWAVGSDAAPSFGELLLVAGSCFFYLRDRAVQLPAIDHLEAVVDDPAATAYLDMELSTGRWDADAQAGEVVHSTLPWCEGRTIRADAGWVPAA